MRRLNSKLSADYLPTGLRSLYSMPLLILTLACQNGSDQTPSETQAKQSPGDLTYSFKVLNFNGSIACETGEHVFASLEKYCLGLRSFDLNNPYAGKSCAVENRKTAYHNRCGKTEFVETNYAWQQFTTQKVDSSGNSVECKSGGVKGEKTFYPTLKDYCSMIKDNRFHNDCGTEQRMKLFKELECPGKF